MSQSSRIRTAAVAAIAALALLTASCGDSDDDAAESAASGAGGAATNALESNKFTMLAAPVEFDSVTDAKWIELLEEAGVTVELKEIEFGPDTTRALVSGEGDVTSNSPVPTMQYLIQSGGKGLTVIGAEVLGTDYILMSTPDIKSVDQLAGKKVGISEPGDISDSLTRVMLTKANVPVDDIDFTQIGGTSDRIAALAANQISGGAAHAADGLTAAKASGLTPLANYWEYIPVYAQRFIAASDKWLEANPNLAQLVVDKLIEANQWAAENKDEYIALSKEYVEEMPDEIREQVYDIFLKNGFFAPDGGLDAIDPTIEVEREQGTLSGELPDVSEWVDPSFVENSAAGKEG